MLMQLILLSANERKKAVYF